MDTRRDFVFIDDLVAVVEKAVDSWEKNGIYHISTGVDYSIQEVFNAVVSAMNVTLNYEVEVRPRKPDDSFSILIDPTVTNRDFDWKATTPLFDAVQAAVAWYSDHVITGTYSHLKPKE